jgi:hypothetical protein
MTRRLTGSTRFLLTHANVAVVLVTTAATIGGLSFGFRHIDALQQQAAPVSDDRSLSVPGDAREPRSPSQTAAPGSSTPIIMTPASAPARLGPVKSSTTRAGLGGSATLESIAARSGPGQIVMSWRMSGGSGAQVRARISGSDGSRPASTCVPTTTGCTFANLTNGVEYTVELTLLRGTTAVAKQIAKAIPYPAVLSGRTTRLWFDPAQTDNLITDGRRTAPGSAVRHLLDRSGSGSDAGPVSGHNRPTIRLVNGHPALSFEGSSALSFPASSLPSGDAVSTVYAVAGLNDAEAETRCFGIMLTWGGLGRNAARQLHKGCGTSLAFADTFDTWAEAKPTLAWRQGQAQVIRADFAPSSLQVWLDGISSYTWSQPAGQTMSTARSADGLLGAAPWLASGDGWRGTIAEVIVLSVTPTQAENASIMQYLQRKWGL